jgi:ribosome-associated toxin RatA of RatAB toxin-antitoxin module
MRKICRSALVPFTADKMYALVDDIEAYPEFLRWCRGAEVHQRGESIVEATLDLQRAAIKKSFRTRNTVVPGQSIELQLVGGPFSHFRGGWQFLPLGESGCKVTFELEFEFSNPVSDRLFAALVEDTSNTLVDAFIERAVAVYGREESA